MGHGSRCMRTSPGSGGCWIRASWSASPVATSWMSRRPKSTCTDSDACSSLPVILDEEDPQRVALLTEALGLWHGEALAGVPGEWASRARRACERQRLDAVLVWADANLRRGDQDGVIAVLSDLVDEHPFAESLAAALMRALQAAGRAAEALAVFARIRRTLAEELGTNPGAELTELHYRLLRGVGDRRPVQLRAVPAQLPMSVPAFVGRSGELARLDRVVAATEEGDESAVVLVIGSPGTGKTALAVHWARHVAGRFPDGQLFVDLHGYNPAVPSMSPAEALRGFLDTLGVESQRVPIHLQAQSALYRSLLHRRRMLVLLDNARNVEQVRPLLPGHRVAWCS